jgi:hypothetical protein
VTLGLSPAQRHDRAQRGLTAIASVLPFAFAFLGMDGEEIVLRVAAMRLADGDGPAVLLTARR